MKNAKQKYLISKESTIGDALVAITENKRGCAIVVDENGVLLGVASDGDVRRALVKGATELTPIVKIINRNVLSFNDVDLTAEKVKNIFSEHQEVNLIPVVSAGNIVVDIIVREKKTA